MPAPQPRSYNPESLGAKCSECPLNCSGKLPVPPRAPTDGRKPRALIVIESPDGRSKYKGTAMQGNASRALDADLREYGLPPEDTTLVHRIACNVPPAKRTDSILRKAANACLPRALREIEALAPDTDRVKTLYLGKWAPNGIVTSAEYKAALEIKMSQGVMRGNHMILPHPRIAYFAKPAGRAVFQTSLQRFVQATQGYPWPQWPTDKMVIEPTEQALEWLRTMGPCIAYDAETLGTDPLSAPITVIGISDGDKTVSLGWVSYSNRFGYYNGIVDSSSALPRALVKEVTNVLESDREMCAHNGAYDILAMESIGIRTRVDFDTLDAYKIINPEMPANLEAVSAHLLELPTRWKTEFRAGRDDDAKGASEFAESPREKLLYYNAKDTLTTRWLRNHLIALLEKDY